MLNMAKSKVKKFNGLPSKVEAGAERKRIVKTITIEVICEPEDRDPEGECHACGDDAVDREQEKWIRHQLEEGNPWAWCQIAVKATVDDFEGFDYLCGCSYLSGADFCRGSGYFDDMVSQAVTEALKKRSDAARAEYEAKRKKK